MERMEKYGRRGIAGDGYAKRGAWEGMEGRLGGCHLRFFLDISLVLWYTYGVLKRESRKEGTENVRIR